LIQPEPALFYFVNRIAEAHKIAFVVVETPKQEKKSMLVSAKSLASSILSGSKKDYLESVYNRYFGNKWHSLTSDLEVIDCEDINSDAIFDKLKTEKPDLILDHGTSIVKDHVLETGKLALNLHWGLSPYYRGSYCTEWALINWDPYNIGVTIHKLSKHLDGGEILAQQRAVVESADTPFSINMQLTKMGTELVIEAIKKLDSGEELDFKAQDFSQGFITLNRQRSKFIRKQVKYIERNGIVDKMLKHPARKDKLPIVEMRDGKDEV
jgi:methionyl-tRNA formyltransferase